MKYKKITNLLDKTPDQPTKFRTKNWVEINDEERGTYNTNNQIKFKTSILMSSLCDYSDAYILAKGTITVARVAAPAPAYNAGKKVVFKNCAPFTDYISETNNTQIHNAKPIDVIIPMHNLIEYSNNYLETSGSLWQYYSVEPALTDAGAIANFHSADSSASFKFKQKITSVTDANGTKMLK